ncbi:MAG: hypothetical protein R2864_06260 [Syntrophotaleaceae bacterium]
MTKSELIEKLSYSNNLLGKKESELVVNTLLMGYATLLLTVSGSKSGVWFFYRANP